MKRTAFLFLIIFLEGYVVLSTELLAIRQTLPFVGSGTDTVSIIIAAVLMPLAFGYYAGGQYRGNVRRKLVKNLLISACFLTVGLSYYILSLLFGFFIDDLKIHNRLWLTTIYACTFLVIPIYLLGQTVPLISHYFPRTRLPEAAGKILFFSTVGSFLGAVFTTIILMNLIGVAYTATTTIAIIALLYLLLTKATPPKKIIIATFCLMTALVLNSTTLLTHSGIVANNVYSTVQIVKEGQNRPVKHFKINGSYSSAMFEDNNDLVFKYANYIDHNFLKTLRVSDKKGEILIIGSGGFTLGLKDDWNHYTYVDIDSQLQQIAEETFLNQKLLPNKTVISQPIRSYLTMTDKQYDLVILDVGRGISGIPEHLVTQNFFQQIEHHIKKDGIFIANYFISIMMDDPFTQSLDATIRSVFPHVNRQIMSGYNPWDIAENQHASVLYISRKRVTPYLRIYTDNTNRSSLEKPAKAAY